MDKENIAEGLQVGSSFSKSATGLPASKASKKSRSKSIGPGGLEVPLKEDTGNRRKSAIIPAVRSILSTKDNSKDEEREAERKRKEARRKSLANRRVSFAPEATLHTWDVIEYMRDATTSSSSSGSTRRNSAASQASARSPQRDVDSSPAVQNSTDIPSTPPEQVEEPPQESSPANQRDLHQAKRRRSSGIPPINFNNPEDEFSSSPTGDVPDAADQASDDEGGDMTMDISPEKGSPISQPNNGPDSTGSSSRLDAALREAAQHAGTREVEAGDDGEMSMELADDEITAAFKPWVQRSTNIPKLSDDLTSAFDQENVDPFSPAHKNRAVTGLAAKFAQAAEESEGEGDDMSMDITHALGGILPKPQSRTLNEEDMSMDFTTVFGGIKNPAHTLPPNDNTRKRRRSSATENGELVSLGSPAKRQTNRRTSLRRRKSIAEESAFGDETMDMTMAVGGIQRMSHSASEEPEVEENLGEDTMDFTVAVGGIKSQPRTDESVEDAEGSDYDNEELSMEMTTVLGGIRQMNRREQQPVEPSPSPAKEEKPESPIKTKKSPGRPRKSLGLEIRNRPSPSAAEESTTPRQSPRKSPRKSLALSLLPSTPEGRRDPETPLDPQKESKQESENNSAEKPIIFEQPQPTTTPEDPVSYPSLETSTIVESAVESSTVSQGKEISSILPALEQLKQQDNRTVNLSDTIKLLSTPRKMAAQPSPVKRPTSSTSTFTPTESPKKDPTPRKLASPRKSLSPRKSMNPRQSMSPKKNIQIRFEEPVQEQEPTDDHDVEEGDSNVEHIPLQEFLNMTNIRFMELTTTKRRHTGHPFANSNKRGSQLVAEEGDATMDDYVAAAACTLPEYEMYQHACHELKRYISGGKDVVRQIEADVYEENPALFKEYLSAPPDQRYLMDNQFKNMKTYARLKSKEGWYGWRTTLLNDLKSALTKTSEEFKTDEEALREQEKLIEAAWPEISSRHEKLVAEHKVLQQRADELASCDREELEATRERLSSVQDQIEKKKLRLQMLQQELKQKEESIELVKERKIECAEEIKMAEKVREECRGWTTSEVNALKDSVSTLVSKYGWLITSASTNPSYPTPSITMTYLNDLQLYFHPLSFSSTSPSTNTPVSLTYIGDEATPRPSPLTTTKRFFLQLLRAHLHSVPHATTSIGTLLRLIKSGWDLALAVSSGVRSLELEGITTESILGDERMSVETMLLLPKLRSKVRIGFEVVVAIEGEQVKPVVKTKAEVVYGEKYHENRMAEFLGQHCKSQHSLKEELGAWGDAVRELRERLLVRGRKGERVDYD